MSPHPFRLASLLPAGTEIVCAHGADDLLVGISHECDCPSAITALPRLTTTPVQTTGSSAEIDARVRRMRSEGRAVIAVDGAALLAVRPDLVLAQDLCDVCAVVDGEARSLARTFERPRVVVVEWLEPLDLAGHWTPELVALASGRDVGSTPGAHSVRSSWPELIALAPDLMVSALCGFGIDRAVSEWRRFAVSDTREARSAGAFPIGAHDHGGAHRDPAGAADLGGLQGALPGRRDFEAEPPGVRHIGFRAAEDAGGFVIRRVEPMGMLVTQSPAPSARSPRFAHRADGG